MKQRRSIDTLSALHNTHRALNLVRNKLMSGVNANMPAARSMARKRLANAMFDSFTRTIGSINAHTMHRLNLDGSVAAVVRARGACTHGVQKWLSPQRGGGHTLVSHGEAVERELFCVEKR